MKFSLLKKEELEKKALIPGAEVTFAHSGNITMAEWYFEAGTNLPLHSHPHEQITKVISGNFELSVDGETYELCEGSVALIPPNSNHSGKAINKCHLIDVFHPVREDYK